MRPDFDQERLVELDATRVKAERFEQERLTAEAEAMKSEE